MIFGSTQVFARLPTTPNGKWESLAVSQLLPLHLADRGSVQVMSYSGSAFVAADPGIFRICGYSQKAVKVEVPRDDSIEGALVLSSLLSYSASVSVQAKPSTDCIPDACRLTWKSSIYLAERHRTGRSMGLFGKVTSSEVLKKLPSSTFSSGSGSKDHPLYQIHTEVYGNVVLASGLVVHCL